MRGFSLIELSIVLVILGLLTGGILAGQSLIRASEVRSVGTQYQSFVTAAQSFRDKYLAIPGDMANATSFWGAVAAGAACQTAVSTDVLTCNGNGNGIIENPGGSPNTLEFFRFWQHLINAGLIGGQYDGVGHSSTNMIVAAASTTPANSPAGRLSNSLWFSYGWGVRTGSTAFFDGDYSRSFQFGGYVPDSDNAMPNLKPEELWNIDSKYDDGKPATGKIRVRDWNSANFNKNLCTDATASSQKTANYALSVTDQVCETIFPNAY